MKKSATFILLALMLPVSVLFSQQRAAAPVDAAKLAAANVVSDPGFTILGELAQESFEGATFPPDGWAKLTDFGGSGWERFTVGSDVQGFQSGGNPVQMDAGPQGGGGAVALASWFTGDQDGDFATGQETGQWLITPQIMDVQAGDSLVFYVLYFLQFGDNLDILISTTDRDSTQSFTVQVASLQFSGATSGIWERHSFALVDFVDAGSDVYVAFKEHVANTANEGDALFLDLVEVTSLATGVADEPAVPGRFELKQNYPNPFNPSTRITFSLPQQSQVTLTVHNLLGQVVATVLNNQSFGAGEHSVPFDASRLANGIYYYRIEAGAFKDVKKMTLLK